MTLYFRFNLEFHMVYNKNDIFIARLIARGFQSFDIHMRNFEI